MYEDDPGWDCATMGNLTCGAGAFSPSQGYIHELTVFAPVTVEGMQALPDTSMDAPSGLPLDGIGLVLVLLATLIFRRTGTR